jgi:RNA polymerase sigma-70 factor (ECF subfamily)
MPVVPVGDWAPAALSPSSPDETREARRLATQLATETRPAPGFDSASVVWLAQLRSDGPGGNRALRRLHELLLKMAYARLLPRQERLSADVVDELALEAADQAVVAVLAHLDDFRGASRFTTWACQFAVTEVSVTLRRYRRQRREVPVEPEVIMLLTGSHSSVDRDLEQLELLQVVCAAVNEALTPRQREVLLALAVDGDSARALAVSLQTKPGALYKSLHDARCKLRERLTDHGLTPPGAPAEEFRAAQGKNSGQRDSNSPEAMGATT